MYQAAVWSQQARMIDSFRSFFGVENDRDVQVMPLSTH